MTTINLYNLDCMEFMRTVPDKHYELAIVDPPYGIGAPNMSNLKGYKGRAHLNDRLQKNRLNSGSGKLKNRTLNTSNCEWDNTIPSQEYFEELFRVSRNQIIWGGNYFPLPVTRCVICWDKCQPWDNFSQWEMAWSSFNSPAPIFRFDNRTGGKIHPTQKPVSLYIWLLDKYAKTSDKVLDTHGGSMSIVIACMKMGLSLDCCELDIDYFDSAVARVKRHAAQLDLFKPQPEINIHKTGVKNDH